MNIMEILSSPRFSEKLSNSGDEIEGESTDSDMKLDEIIKDVPTIIFIVPYRDREDDKRLFSEQMNLLLQDSVKSYEILYVHQTDSRDFNRGAMKNIGFLVVKNKYPDDYKQITLCFNDIDTYPCHKGIIDDYSTIPGIVKHFYGYLFALGGIVSICGIDFEKINGFPNYWSWGYEDNAFNERVIKASLSIDRCTFYAIGDEKIHHFSSSTIRIVNRIEFTRYVQKVKEGIQSIRDLTYYVDKNGNEFMANITTFNTEYKVRSEFNEHRDMMHIRTPFNIGYSTKKRCSLNLVFY